MTLASASNRISAARLAAMNDHPPLKRIPRGGAWSIIHHQAPEGFRGFSTREIEDILCIYKDDFLLTPVRLRARVGGPFSPPLRPFCRD